MNDSTQSQGTKAPSRDNSPNLLHRSWKPEDVDPSRTCPCVEQQLPPSHTWDPRTPCVLRPTSPYQMAQMALVEDVGWGDKHQHQGLSLRKHPWMPITRAHIAPFCPLCYEPPPTTATLSAQVGPVQLGNSSVLLSSNSPPEDPQNSTSLLRSFHWMVMSHARALVFQSTCSLLFRGTLRLTVRIE